MLWKCSESALKVLWNFETALRLLRNSSEIALILWIYSETWKLLWNCSKTALKLLWKCSETALELWNCSESALKLWNCSKSALKLPWNCSEIDRIKPEFRIGGYRLDISMLIDDREMDFCDLFNWNGCWMETGNPSMKCTLNGLEKCNAPIGCLNGRQNIPPIRRNHPDT